MAKKNQTLLYVAGIILVIIFAGQSGFLGSFLTTCTNQEPTADYGNSILMTMGGTSIVQSTQVIEVGQGNNTVQYNMAVNRYTFLNAANVTTSFDTLQHLALTCPAYLDIIKENNTLALAIHNTKQGNVLNGYYYWCSPNNVITYKGDLTSFQAYANAFIVCQTVEINETKLKIDDCATKHALYDEVLNQCYCEDESAFDSVTGCAVEDNETSSSSSSGTSSSTTTTSTTPSTTREKSMYEKLTTGTGPYYLAGLAVLLILYYFYYEKGKNKGLIQKRRGRFVFGGRR